MVHQTLPVIKVQLKEYLAALSAVIPAESKEGYGNDNKGAEVVVRDIMNALYGLELQLEKKSNSAGFDLLDQSRKVMVQVTSNCTHQKVQDCLRTTLERVQKEPDLQKGTLYIAFLTVEDDDIELLRENAKLKLGLAKPKGKRTVAPYPFVVDGFKFDPDQHIINFNNFLQNLRDGDLNASQLYKLEDFLKKFRTPVYLAEEICCCDPELRQRYFKREAAVTLNDIRGMLEDPTTEWAEDLRRRLNKPAVPLPHGESVLLFPFDSDKKFLTRLLPRDTMETIDRACSEMAGSVVGIMDGTYPDSLRKEILKGYSRDIEYNFRELKANCDTLCNSEADKDALVGRLCFMAQLLDTGGLRPSLVTRCIQDSNPLDTPWKGLAALVFYALVGERCFKAVVDTNIFSR